MATTPAKVRRARWICALTLLSLPPLLVGAKHALDSNRNNVLDWLPSSFDETARLFWFVERFGSDEILVASWPGCTLDDARLDQLAARLVQPPKGPRGELLEPLFWQVFTGRETLAELTAPPLELDRADARQRMRGWLLGPDGQTTCAVALVSTAGALDRPAALRHLEQVASECGIRAEELRIGGPTADSVAIDRASQRRVLQLGLLSAFVGLLLAWLCLWSFRLVALLFLTATFSWAASLSLVYWSGANMDAVLLMMPALVFVLAISAGVHLTNYYNDGLAQPAASLPDDAPGQALSRGWLPCVLASLTTSLGLGSLAISHITPVRKFGIFAAAGVLIGLLSTLVFWPALARCWPLSGKAQDRRGGVSETPKDGRSWWYPLQVLATRYAGWILGVAALTLPLCGYGITQLRTSTQLQDLLSPQSRLVLDYHWLQEHLGPLVPVEVVLAFPRQDDDRRTLLPRAECVEQLRQRLAQLPEVGGTMAATTFAPPMPQGQGARQMMLRRVLTRRLLSYRQDFVDLRLIYDDRDEQLWRISVRVPAMQTDYGPFLSRLEQEVDAFLADRVPRSAGPAVARICGGVPLIYMAQQQLLEDLIESFLLAFALIGITMVVLMRGLLAGMLTMIPNVFPALVAFGFMGLNGNPIDIGTMMTASAALGIAVDDTLHFLVWFRRGMQRYHAPPAAVQFAFQHCATAMLQTSLICGMGLLVFVFSPFQPIGRFAQVMAVLLLLALLGDLVLLPALLCSPLGRCLARDRGPGRGPGGHEPAAVPAV